MARLHRILPLIFTLIFSALGTRAASSSENRDFSAAVGAFEMKLWERAETDFAKFIERFPNSEQRIEAILLQAEARYYLTNFNGAIQLLETHLDAAAGRADEYRFWIAEAYFKNGDYTNAAAAYGSLLASHSKSRRRLEALVGEASSRSRLGHWDQVIALLARTDGEFNYWVATSITNEVVINGLLLLAEARLERSGIEIAEGTLRPMTNLSLNPTLSWRSNYIRYRAQKMIRNFQEALVASSNLVGYASKVTADRPLLLAQSVASQANALEALGRRQEAVGVWKLNLAATTPEERRREALLKSVQISMALGDYTAAEETLQKFLTDNPAAPASDAAMLTLGELELRRRAVNTEKSIGETNRLNAALNWFTRLIESFPKSPLAGKAELYRGWCYWLRQDWASSAATFTRALTNEPPAHLSDVEDVSIARYKLGDALFQQENFVSAQTNYRAALEIAPRAPRLREFLPPLAWRQIFRCALKMNDESAAAAALREIERLPLGDGNIEGAMIDFGQFHFDAGKPQQALEDLERFASLFPNATNRADAELLIARTRELQSDWRGAVTNYTEWIARYPTNVLRPQAEFQRAVAMFSSGDETNALTAMTNFIAIFHTNSLAPRAMWWLGDFYFRGSEFPEAEKNYKLLFQNWPKSELADEAVMMAGRAAVAWGNYDSAIEHFTLLTANLTGSNWAQAVFAYADTLMLQAARDTNKLANYTLALQRLATIPTERRFQTNEIAALAWGEMAKCYLQMGSATWSNAVTAFSNVIAFPAAGVAARSEAQVGLGLLQEKMAQIAPTNEQARLLRSASDNYFDVVLGKNLREGETRDAFWVKLAGLEGARLLDSLHDWERLAKLCERMEQLIPVLSSRWQRHIEVAKKNIELQN